MRAVICGANGAMGKLLCQKLGEAVVGRVSADGGNGVSRTFEDLGEVKADVVIDFSHHTAVSAVLAYAKKIDDKDRERVYIGSLLTDIWGPDYMDKASELAAADNNFRRIYKRLYPAGII